MSWPPVTISDYYRAAVEQVSREVEATADDRVLGIDLDEWIDYLVRRAGLEPIEIDAARQPEMFELELSHTLRRDDIYSGRSAGSVVRTTQIRVTVPVIPSDTLTEIWKHAIAPNTFSMVTYPEYDYDERLGVIATTVPMEQAAVKTAIDNIKSATARYNSSIESENQTLRSRIAPIAKAKLARVTEKHSRLDTLAAAVGIPLTKKADPGQSGAHRTARATKCAASDASPKAKARKTSSRPSKIRSDPRSDRQPVPRL